MAKLYSNKKPVKRKHDDRVRIGTCSNCKSKKTGVLKVRGALVCTDKCLGTPAPLPSLAEIAQSILG